MLSKPPTYRMKPGPSFARRLPLVPGSTPLETVVSECCWTGGNTKLTTSPNWSGILATKLLSLIPPTVGRTKAIDYLKRNNLQAPSFRDE